MFYISRHSDIVEISLDPATFPQGGFTPQDEKQRPFDQLGLGETDPPLHTPVRRAMAKFFHPQVMRRIEPEIAKLARDIVGAVVECDSFDLVQSIAAPLPARVMGHLLGLGDELVEHLSRYSSDYITARAVPGTPEGDTAIARCEAFEEELRLLIRRRSQSRETPDLLGAVMDCVIDGEPISETKVLTHLTNDLIVGGIDTTTHLIGNLFVELLQDRSHFERVRADRSLIPIAVEETLRHLGPLQVVFRRTAADVVLSGVEVPAGSLLILGLSSGSRDDTVCPHANAFDLSRPGNARRHLGFNIGQHLCVGAPLARMEAAVLLDIVLDAMPDLTLTEDFVYERVPLFFMRGATRIPVYRGQR
ncbi:cytochrome P450 [Nocardia sp. CA2R105]|uniref:cytochrome P450 n=1 Tax=Nocardia coffeae TaxID=2873381 RepID=UPI001CA668D4|nr:cytochrome P450 [Nocardia coffeae]MBY8863573.1 cytochrome P450 [Nocardia coffeae]